MLSVGVISFPSALKRLRIIRYCAHPFHSLFGNKFPFLDRKKLQKPTPDLNLEDFGSGIFLDT